MNKLCFLIIDSAAGSDDPFAYFNFCKKLCEKETIIFVQEI